MASPDAGHLFGRTVDDLAQIVYDRGRIDGCNAQEPANFVGADLAPAGQVCPRSATVADRSDLGHARVSPADLMGVTSTTRARNDAAVLTLLSTLDACWDVVATLQVYGPSDPRCVAASDRAMARGAAWAGLRVELDEALHPEGGR
jgi:hypothetical protein